MLGKERKEIHHFDIQKHKWTKDQRKVIFIFLFVIIGWIFRGLITDLTGFKYGDEGIALLGAIALFFISYFICKLFLFIKKLLEIEKIEEKISLDFQNRNNLNNSNNLFGNGQHFAG